MILTPLPTPLVSPPTVNFSNKSYYSNKEWLDFIEFILHNNYANEEYLINYFVLELLELYNKL